MGWVGCGILTLLLSENGSDAVLGIAGTARNGLTKLDPCRTLSVTDCGEDLPQGAEEDAGADLLLMWSM